jgi:hypothetical protein
MSGLWPDAHPRAQPDEPSPDSRCAPSRLRDRDQRLLRDFGAGRLRAAADALLSLAATAKGGVGTLLSLDGFTPGSGQVAAGHTASQAVQNEWPVLSIVSHTRACRASDCSSVQGVCHKIGSSTVGGSPGARAHHEFQCHMFAPRCAVKRDVQLTAGLAAMPALGLLPKGNAKHKRNIRRGPCAQTFIHAFGKVTPRCPWYLPARSL